MNVPSKHIISTAEQSQALDAQTSNEFGIDAFTLMEVAGGGAADFIKSKMETGSKGLFLCGKGNNGGDALVAARYLAQKGVEVTAVFVSGSDDLSPLAEKNRTLLQKIADNDPAVSVTVIDSWPAFDLSRSFHFIVDGMLGTGLNSDLRGDILKAVEWCNRQAVPCFAMDIPTGLHADSGKIMGQSIKADYTCSFGTLKQGFYLNDGFKCRGYVHFCELPFPDYLKRGTAFLMDESGLPPAGSKTAAHKYQAGVVYVIGGSEGLTGAAMMAAKSAWAAGVGAVILVCPKGLLPIFENNLPQIIKKPVGGKNDSYFRKEHLDEVASHIAEKEGTVLIGPGLGREEGTVRFVNRFLDRAEKDCVIDADALWAMAQKNKWNNHGGSSYILTPHPGELQNLLGLTVSDDQKRLKQVKAAAEEHNVTILSKGFPVIVANGREEIYISGYDSRRFSRAGFGDVLAGKVASFKALGDKADEACIRALWSGEKKMKRLMRKYPEYTAEPEDVL